MTLSESGLFDREAPEELLSERTALVAAEKSLILTDLHSILVFRIGTEWLALPTAFFDEVVEQCKIHSLPHHRDGLVSGIVNIRGELLLCVAFGALLGLGRELPPERREGNRVRAPRLLVCSRERSRLAFQVNEVHGVVRYHQRDLRALPGTLSKETPGTFSRGMLPWTNHTLGCLDEDLVYYALNRGIA
jgi:chemotaxis-related protein WspD